MSLLKVNSIGAYSGTVITFIDDVSFAGSFITKSISATTYNNLPIDVIVTGGTYDNGTATFTNNTGGTFTVSGFKTNDVFVTGGTYDNGTTTFTNNTGGTFNVVGFKTNDIFVTGGTYDNGTATFTNNTGGTFNVVGFYNGGSFWTSGSTGSFSIKCINDSNLDAFGSYSYAEGFNTMAYGDYSHAEGQNTTTSGTSAHAEGESTIASGYASHAEGGYTTASGQFSHAEGNSTIASGQNSHAEGQNSMAIGVNSHAEGSAIASGQTSHAEGFLTKSIGQYSHAEGYDTQAIGDSSHAEGGSTQANGIYSHAEGGSTQANGIYSHAGGYYTVAGGNYSFVHGVSSEASGEGTIVLGNSITGISTNTVYVNNLVINNLTTGTSISSLGVSNDGKIISGNTNISDAIYTVNSDLSAENTTNATTSIMVYGVNVFSGVTATDFATKLPQPVTGKSVKVINNGSTLLHIFPSNVGGRVNNLPIDTPAVIPPDGNLYEFICIKNPLPGEWTFSEPATGQYDSGEISISISAGTYSGLNPVVSAYDSTRVYITNQFSSVNWGYNGKNKSNLITTNYGGGKYTVAFRPDTPWKGISKIKVYTNLLTDSAKGTQVRLLAGGESSYYSPFDSTMLNSAVVGDNNELFMFNLDKKITGSASTGTTIYSSANIGDAGTVWDESVAYSDTFSAYTDVSLGGVGGTLIGNKSLGVAVYPYGQTWDNTGNEINTGDSVDVYYSSFISFQIKPFQEYFNYGVIPDFKFRFIIEYYQ